MMTMNDEKRRPYLSDRKCGKCLTPLEISEYREAGWMFATYRCAKCDFRQVISFSPQELAEWERRSRTRVAGAEF